MTIRVVVVDDQALVRTGFAAILSTDSDLEVVGEATNGAEAVDVCRSQRPDVVLMDIRMPVMDGVEATRILASGADAGGPRVLMLTTFDSDDLVLAALRAGAAGFLLKDALPEELSRAIKIVAAGEALLAPSVTRRLIARLTAADRATRTSTVSAMADTEARAKVERLTKRERDVLIHMAEGLSNTEIGAAMYVAETTVKTHISRIFTKVEARDRTQAVIVAYRAGLMVGESG